LILQGLKLDHMYSFVTWHSQTHTFDIRHLQVYVWISLELCITSCWHPSFFEHLLEEISCGAIRDDVDPGDLANCGGWNCKERCRDEQSVTWGHKSSHGSWVAGWWFGTWILWLSIQLGISSSLLTFTPSFFRGVAKIHQQRLGILGQDMTQQPFPKEVWRQPPEVTQCYGCYMWYMKKRATPTDVYSKLCRIL
jgi:hypothetical protein